MLCSDIYRDYEADYSAASGAEEEEEGWKQREEDEEEGSGKLFTSSQHAFACYPHVRFLLNPRTAAHGTVVSPQAVVPLPHPHTLLKRLDFSIHLTTQRCCQEKRRCGSARCVKASIVETSAPRLHIRTKAGFFPKLCLLRPNPSVCHIFPPPQLSPAPLLFTDVPLTRPARGNNLFMSPFCA